MEAPCFVIWLEKEAHIASFHAVEGWKQLEFKNEEYFQNFSEGLRQQGYRFQYEAV